MNEDLDVLNLGRYLERDIQNVLHKHWEGQKAGEADCRKTTVPAACETTMT